MADIVHTPGVMGGQPRLDGHRISVLQIAERVHEQGMDPETITAEFDIELADIHRALTYYYDNIDEMTQWRKQRAQRIQDARSTWG